MIKIRSQSKKVIMYCSCIVIESGVNSLYRIVNYIGTDSFILGREYSEEQALKILDDIQFRIDTGQTSSIFEMPM